MIGVVVVLVVLVLGEHYFEKTLNVAQSSQNSFRDDPCESLCNPP